ncbi:MAG: archaellin/type IV pilin N-terminal domain-containing protein [Zestosphaera sp.]
MKLNKAISPILATVILIAVTLVIAIGVIGWIMGIWGTFGTTETIQIYPDSKLKSNGTISLHVKNTGTATAIIYKIEIAGVGSTEVTSTLTPGQETTISATISGDLTAGASYQVKVYTRAGNVYTVTLMAEYG